MRAWRLSCEATEHAELEAFAAEVPGILAAAVDRAFREGRGRPTDRAWLLAYTWTEAVLALRASLAARGVELPAHEVPRQIDHLRLICERFGTTGRT